MKKSLFLIWFVLIASFAYADLYALFNGSDCKGVTSIKDEHTSNWTKKFTLYKVNETFRGKQGYEIELKSGKPSLKSQADIDTYKQQKEAEAKAKEKTDTLTSLGLTEQDLQKIKNL